jgi:hypothetical protein
MARWAHPDVRIGVISTDYERKSAAAAIEHNCVEHTSEWERWLHVHRPSRSAIDLADYNDFEIEQRVCLARADRKHHRECLLATIGLRTRKSRLHQGETQTFIA